MTKNRSQLHNRWIKKQAETTTLKLNAVTARVLKSQLRGVEKMA